MSPLTSPAIIRHAASAGKRQPTSSWARKWHGCHWSLKWTARLPKATHLS